MQKKYNTILNIYCVKNVINGTIGKFIMLEKLLTIRSFTHIKCYLLPYIISICRKCADIKKELSIDAWFCSNCTKKKKLGSV